MRKKREMVGRQYVLSVRERESDAHTPLPSTQAEQTAPFVIVNARQERKREKQRAGRPIHIHIPPLSTHSRAGCAIHDC